MLNKNYQARVKLLTSHVPNLLLISENNRVLLRIRFSACEVRRYEVVNLVLLTTGQHPSKPLYFIGPYDQHHLLVSGIGALLCHYLHCFPSQSQTLFGIGAGPLLIYNGVCIFATFLKAERERMHFFFLNRGQKSCAAVSRPKPYQSLAPGLPGWLT